MSVTLEAQMPGAALARHVRACACVGLCMCIMGLCMPVYAHVDLCLHVGTCMWVCICMWICVCVYVNMRICVCMWVCVCTYGSVSTHGSISMCACVGLCLHVDLILCVHVWDVCTCVGCGSTCVCAFGYVSTCVCSVDLCAYICVYLHVWV